jgi:exosortase A-associated hydrolase 1
MNTEQPLFFDCAGERMLGILHHIEGNPTAPGVLLVVGGPQYRVGSHRQFVLLARGLAAAGIPVFRFDHRGMGDSTGQVRDFETISEDIHAALDTFLAAVPGLRRVVLWGLCDAATANAFYARTDRRVAGQVALNPWARTSEGEAQAFIRHYYLKRVLSASFWRKIFGLKFNAVGALKDFFGKLGQSRRAGPDADQGADGRTLPDRLRESQINADQPILLILSGQDLTAREYENRVAESSEWRQWMASPTVTLCRLEEADHTFSCAAWRDQVTGWTRDWVRKLPV